MDPRSLRCRLATSVASAALAHRALSGRACPALQGFSSHALSRSAVPQACYESGPEAKTAC